MNRDVDATAIGAGAAIGIFAVEVATGPQSGSLPSRLGFPLLLAAVAFLVVVSVDWFTSRSA
jgi:hypothetical protein